MDYLSKMIRSKVLLLILLFFSSGAILNAKKVVCIDAGTTNDSFLNGNEGRERQIAQNGDIIVKGGTLTDCLALLADGDSLVVVAHGVEKGEGFEWGGNQYFGFGDGEDQMPVPAGLAGKNIKIRWVGCWSTRDPDGSGSDKSITQKLKEKCGSGSTTTGYTDLAQARVCWSLTGGTKSQRNAADRRLQRNPNWMKKPPHNRPNPPADNDKAAAQAIVDSVSTSVTVTLTYYKTKNVVQTPPQNSNGTTVENESCGFYTSMTEDQFSYGRVGYYDEFIWPDGLWRQDEQIQFIFPEEQSISIRNLRVHSTMPFLLPPDPLLDLPVLVNYTAYAQVSFDGLNWDDYEGGGILDGVLQPAELVDEDAVFYDLLINDMNMSLDGPNGPVILLKGPSEASGINILEPETEPEIDPDWWVESFFDVYFQMDNGMGQLGFPTSRSQFYLTCAIPEPGCAQQDAMNFNPCSIINDMCVYEMFGCTNPLAVNWNPEATTDDGSCLLIGCMDELANNYNPYANESGDCDFTAPCPTDLNGDMITNTGDLVLLLTAYGDICE